MYKVFYNDRVVFFTENIQNIKEDINTTIHHFKNKRLLRKALEDFISKNELINMYVVHEDVQRVFKKYTKLYKFIEAAGGLVRNAKGEILVIYRREKWDLPKGKLERNELPEIGATREVEEECGISNINIIKLIKTTYHTYRLKNKDILKRTYWYEMIHHGNQELIPQTEEEITEAKWINIDHIDEIKSNTFLSIIEVLNNGS